MKTAEERLIKMAKTAELRIELNKEEIESIKVKIEKWGIAYAQKWGMEQAVVADLINRKIDGDPDFYREGNPHLDPDDQVNRSFEDRLEYVIEGLNLAISNQHQSLLSVRLQVRNDADQADLTFAQEFLRYCHVLLNIATEEV